MSDQDWNGGAENDRAFRDRTWTMLAVMVLAAAVVVAFTVFVGAV